MRVEVAPYRLCGAAESETIYHLMCECTQLEAGMTALCGAEFAVSTPALNLYGASPAGSSHCTARKYAALVYPLCQTRDQRTSRLRVVGGGC